MAIKTRKAKTTEEHLEECGTIVCRGYFGCTRGPEVPNKSKHFYKVTECGKLAKYTSYSIRDNNPFTEYFIVGICEECQEEGKFTNYYKILGSGFTFDFAVKVENERVQSLENWRNLKDKIWTTKERERIPVGKMTESHLKNVIDYQRRKINELGMYIGYDHENNSFDVGLEITAERSIKARKEWIAVFKAELNDREYCCCLVHPNEPAMYCHAHED